MPDNEGGRRRRTMKLTTEKSIKPVIEKKNTLDELDEIII